MFFWSHGIYKKAENPLPPPTHDQPLTSAPAMPRPHDTVHRVRSQRRTISRDLRATEATGADTALYYAVTFFFHAPYSRSVD